MIKQIKDKVPGILLCLIISIPAWLLGKALPVVGGPVFGIIFGMIITVSLGGTEPGQRLYLFNSGIKYTSKKLLQYSIILLGFEMNLFNVIKVGSQSLVIMLFTISAALGMAFSAGKLLGMEGNTSTLIGVGTSICGGSAIAATAPVIKAKDEEVAHAISTIFLFNIIAVFIFPALGRLLGMSDAGFGIWAGTAINDTSSVVAAGTSWSAAAGNNTALSLAAIVKLTRTLMIVPITLVLAICTARKSKEGDGGTAFKFSNVFPWFVIGFILAAIINTFIGIPAQVSYRLASMGKFMIIMAMAAIGLNTHMKKLLANGSKPVVLGLCCWFTVAASSLLVQIIMKTW